MRLCRTHSSLSSPGVLPCLQVIRRLDGADADASSADLDLPADPEPTRVHVDEEKEVYEFVADHLQPNTKYQVRWQRTE